MEILSDTYFRGDLRVSGLAELSDCHILGDLQICGGSSLTVNSSLLIKDSLVSTYTVKAHTFELFSGNPICGSVTSGESFSSFDDLKTKLNIPQPYSHIMHYTATCPSDLTDGCLKFVIPTTQFRPTTPICGSGNETFCDLINNDGSYAPYYERVLGVYATTTNGGRMDIEMGWEQAQSLFVDVGLHAYCVVVSRASGTDLSSAIFHIVYDHIK